VAADEPISLKTYVDREFNFIRQAQEALTERFDAEIALHISAHEREHTMTNIAIGKAEQALDQRLGAMNAFRSQISDMIQRFPTNDEMLRLEASLVQRIDKLEETLKLRIERNEKSLNDIFNWRSNQMGKQAAIGMLVVVLSVVSIAIGIVSALN
jgi:hypothetical protein